MTLWYHPEKNALAVLWKIPEENTTVFTWGDMFYNGQGLLAEYAGSSPYKLRKLGWILIGDAT